MIDRQQLDRLPGMQVIGAEGEGIGRVVEVYVDDATGEPSFVLVDTGVLGLTSSFVPLDGADIVDDTLQVAATKDAVKHAPGVDDDGYLSPDEEDELYRYYDLRSPSGSPAATSRSEAADQTEEAAIGSLATGGSTGTTRGSADEDTSAEADDDAMTLSEEELRVGVRKKPVGKARLRKHVVTEHVTKTFPVQREVVTVEREPVDESDVDRASEGPEISEGEHEVTLYEEELVVEKRVVPKERVRLAKQVETEHETIEADVAREEIDLAGLEESREDQER